MWFVGWTVFRTWNLEPDDWKDAKAEDSCGTSERYTDSRDAMSSLVIAIFELDWKSWNCVPSL